MANDNAAPEDSVDVNTLLGQEQQQSSGEQQPVDESAAGSSQENQSANDNEAVVEKRLRDTQAKVTELAEQLKAAQTQLQVLQQPREEPFDEEKFIDNFIGGEEAYNKYRDDPALLAKDLAKKMLYHQAQVLVDRDKYWEKRLTDLTNGLRTKDPEYAQYANEIKEFEERFDLSGMTPEDKIAFAKMIRGSRGSKAPHAPPPGPSARKAGSAPKPSHVPAGYLEMLGLAGEGRNDNTLL